MTFEKVAKIIADYKDIDVATITPDSTFSELGVDSLDTVEVGVRSPGYVPMDVLRAGDVGYIAASIKDLQDTRVGDTITDDANPAAEMLPGYRQVNFEDEFGAQIEMSPDLKTVQDIVTLIDQQA